MLDKRQLLSGEPTQIISYEAREKMDSLAEKLHMEAKRRGLVVDIDPVTQEARLPSDFYSCGACYNGQRRDRLARCGRRVRNAGVKCPMTPGVVPTAETRESQLQMRTPKSGSHRRV